MKTILGRMCFAGGIALYLFGSAAVQGQQSGLSTWSSQNSGTTNSLNAIIYNSPAFMAVGNGGVVLTSTDATNWSLQSVGATNNLNAVTYAAGLYVAVGSHESLFSSPDGLTWSNQFKGPGNDLNGVCFGGGQFVAVGANSTILTSPDGTNWTTQLIGVNTNLSAICYGNGCYLAPGMGFGIVTLRSTNGTTWNKINSGPLSFKSIVSANGFFTGVGGNNPVAAGGYIATSPDGITWTTRASGTDENLGGITHGNGCFVAVDGSGPGTFPATNHIILSSPDAISWARHPDPGTNAMHGVAYGNGSFVAVGNRGTILQSGPIFSLAGDSQITSNGYALTLTGEIGRHYRIQAESDLTASNWVDVVDFTNTTESTQVLDNTPTGSPRFYRAIAP